MAYTRPPAPAELERVETFCNSARFLYGEDAFTDLRSARAWLREHGWADAAETADEGALGRLRRLRAALRDHLEDPTAPAAREVLTDLAHRVLGPPRWDDPGERPRLRPREQGAVEALASELLAVLATAELSGGRERLKVCRFQQCRWVYYDRSPGNNSAWCSMDICGARNKMRSYRARREGNGS
ncbi:putative RNA-binding Zn ribbon-like protein [Haloactinospora alba]|uniref:Putative RNA-binding Zn ribbon-like protein n=1 Tax=Haloactinospora alba TaxID=405555 RepID=A0A543NET4_9ACTN|nr:CGNR zinc finger domain-containing protein [Haloactinospora alba]TQN30353.1 putative RNA-binding Zn ribbon-like protein [Haloactinospora alba]